MGGIVKGDDAIEFMLAGATAVSIGAGNFIDTNTGLKTIEGIENYMKKYNIDNVSDIVGEVTMN
jgi:dihydroorotate dehydrogenase (NAD+) catalytic subunit